MNPDWLPVFDAWDRPEFYEKLLAFGGPESTDPEDEFLRAGLLYTISKKFVIQFSQRNVARFAKKGCRILSISPGSYLTPMKFLAVDDSPLQLEYLVFQLKQASPSSEIRSCGDVGEVLRALEEGFAPDVAFLDIEMPDMTGLELAGKIRERQPAAQVVFVTACPQYALDSYSVHAQGYLLKPVTVEKIREELENLFRNVPRPGEEEADRLQVKCFGNFEVFFRGTPLNFRRSKAKELLAYLVMRCAPNVMFLYVSGLPAYSSSAVSA